MEIGISSRDKMILRELAKKQLAYARMEINLKRKNAWYQHNALKGEVPMVHLDAWTLLHELIEPKLQCQGAFAREVENQLYVNFMNQELFDDDRVTPDVFGWNYDTGFKAFDIDVECKFVDGQENGMASGTGMHFVPKLFDLEEDFHKIRPSSFYVDMETSEKKLAAIEDAIGDILPVYMKMDCLYCVPTQMLVHIMSMEDMMYNMMDYPELFLKMMNQMADDFLNYLHMLEDKHLILPTAEFEGVGQATFAFTNELPDTKEVDGRPLKISDVWGFLDSQETVCISPQMFEELVFPCYEKIGSQFGLLSYGCCEPVNRVWDNCISKFKNLRKVSISPWADEEFMGERLRGSGIIYHRKPEANFLGVGTQLDEEALRAHIRKTLHAARGCKLEITQRDVYTINNNPEKGRRYIQILREEIDNNWKG